MSGTASPRVVLTGGTGFTGGLVARELEERRTPFLLTGRDPERLARRATRFRDPDTALVDVTRPETLAPRLSAGDVVINCAGPFARLGGPVVRAAVEGGAHYLDTTGEQRFMMEVVDAWHARARDRGVTVCNAMAFEYAPGDAACALAAAEAGERAGREGLEMDVIYAWGGPASGTSPGTRASVLEVLGSGGLVLEEDAWRQERVGARRRSVELPDGRRRAVSFPAGEVVTAGRDPGVSTLRGWMVAGRLVAGALAVAGPALAPLARGLRPVLEPLFRAAGPEAPSAEARGASEFLILVEARAPGGDRGPASRVRVEGRDPYGLTARLVAAAAAALLDGGGGRPPAGVVPPSAVLPPRRILSIHPELHCATGGRREG